MNLNDSQLIITFIYSNMSSSRLYVALKSVGGRDKSVSQKVLVNNSKIQDISILVAVKSSRWMPW